MDAFFGELAYFSNMTTYRCSISQICTHLLIKDTAVIKDVQ
jgi:hypothetical protein